MTSRLMLSNNILIHSNDSPDIHIVYLKDFSYLKDNFCGELVPHTSSNLSISLPNHNNEILVYLAIDMNAIDIKSLIKYKNKIKKIYIILELCSNIEMGHLSDYNHQYDNSPKNEYEKLFINIISLGEVPININNCGVLFRDFFNPNNNYFDLISKEHNFQQLRESNKPNTALRKGIYLTNVTEYTKTSKKFNLLRCSTNFEGPSDNFRQTDNYIINKVNDMSKHYFDNPAKLNHVLAQIYYNNKDTVTNKDRKASIKCHSDKTKDMPKNGLIAFCSFYDNYHNKKFNDNTDPDIKRSKDDIYDYRYKHNTTILTRLRFRLKSDSRHLDLVKQFDVILYPNSVFMISLDTNRLYTHEIVPSNLPIDKTPIRLGYVVRSSNVEAIHDSGKTYLVKNHKYIEMKKPSEEDVKNLKNVYLEENTTSNIINYDDNINFSLNDGDFMDPII